jgi:Carboxypeptidase regulatory-like domain
MNPGKIRNILQFAAAAGLLLALPVLAADPQAQTDAAGKPKHRALKVPVPADALTGRITDSLTGLGLSEATITFGNQSADSDANGFFTFDKPAQGVVTVSVTRWGYGSSSRSVTVTGGTNVVNFALAGKPVTTLKDTDGVTHVLDAELSQFAALVPFSSPHRSDSAKFCTAGAKETIDKNNIKQILGPGVLVDNASCCSMGPTLQITLKMKDNSTKLATFDDACIGATIDFVGRNRTSGEWEFIHFTNISTIDFP